MFGLKGRIPVTGTLGGSPIVADASPNTTQPPAARVQRVGLKDATSGGTLDLYLFLPDGASVDVTVWVRISELDLSDPPWFQLTASAVTVSALQIAIIEGVPASADIFLQLTNLVGGPTVFGYSFV